ncbi:MAG TPA: hypothetical protein VF721_22425 [Pyrinomonadaceae bacterium]|jgi:hypothetical protein
MSLKSGNPPEKALQVVAEAMQNLTETSHEALGSTMSRAFNAGGVDVAAPLEVYTLTLEEVIEKDLRKAEAAGWRYTLLNADEPVVAAEVNSSGGEDAQFSHFNTGPFVEETARAILQAESLDEVAENDYEARILKIPALYVMALWLHGERDDILIPMPPTNEKLEAQKTYSPKEFFGALAPAADARLSFDDAPDAEKS